VRRPATTSKAGSAIAGQLDLLGLRARWILLDFAFARAANANETDVGCWIFVGFRAALNICSHPKKGRKQPLTCDVIEWAVTGSNRRPLRCKRSALPLS
jgi:hypothetical protein